MKALNEWIDQGDENTLRKLMVFPEFAERKVPAPAGSLARPGDAPPEFTLERYKVGYRACGLVGATNAIAIFAQGATVPAAIEALNDVIASQAGSILSALGD